MSKQEIEQLSAEQAADLAALEAAAGDEAQAQEAAQETEQAAGAVSLADEIAGLVTALVHIAAPMFPSLPGIYTKEATAEASEAAARVCQKHGWIQGGLMGDYAEEITAAAVILPIAFATYQGIKGDIRERQEIAMKRAADVRAHFDMTRNLDGANIPSETPGANTVSAGAPIPAEGEA